MKVRKLPSNPGPAAWSVILPPQPPAEPLEGERRADWLIIGAGFAGLSAARRLRQLRPEDQIVLLEALRVAEGPAGRNSGFMIDLPHDLASEDYGGAVESDRRQIAMNRAAIAFAAEAVKDYGVSSEAFDPCGKVNAAATERGMAHNASYAAHLTRLGEDFSLLDAAEMRALTGVDYYRGGLFTPGVAVLQPALYIRGLAQGGAEQGVAIHENSPVVELSREGATWRARTPGGEVAAPKVILAVNGHAQSFGLWKRRLLHVFTYGSMTRALTPEETAKLGGAARWGITPADPMGSSVRRISGQGGDRIIVRNRFTCEPSMAVSDARLARIARSHDHAFAARFPMLDGVEMEHRWGGMLCLSWNGVPAFGEVESGLYSAVCQNGLGTVKGTLSGMMAAELACDAGSDLLAQFQDHAPPRRLPPAPFAGLGANLRIRWDEMRAGREI